MKKFFLFALMVFSASYLFAADYFNQSVAILTADITTGKSVFYDNVTFKIGIKDSKMYLSMEKGSAAEAITFHVYKVDQADSEMIIFSTSHASDYLTMKSAKQNTFRGALVGILPMQLNRSMFVPNAQGTVEAVCIGFQHEQTNTEQRYYLIFKGSSTPYKDVLQAFKKTYSNINNATNTGQNTNPSQNTTTAQPSTPSAGKNVPAGYVDLGLPSGTYWKSENEKGYYYPEDAAAKFQSAIPTEVQMKELFNHCTWRWEKNGYVVTGPNGNRIFFPAMGGYAPLEKKPGYINEVGDYWLADVKGRQVRALIFSKEKKFIAWMTVGYRFPVRLVKAK